MYDAIFFNSEKNSYDKKRKKDEMAEKERDGEKKTRNISLVTGLRIYSSIQCNFLRSQNEMLGSEVVCFLPIFPLCLSKVRLQSMVGASCIFLSLLALKHIINEKSFLR